MKMLVVAKIIALKIATNPTAITAADTVAIGTVNRGEELSC